MQTSTIFLFCLLAIAGLESTHSQAIDIQFSSDGDLLLVPFLEAVNFYLYTQQNPTQGQELRMNDAASVLNSNFNASNPTRFTIHGWMSNGLQEVNTLLRDAYLARGPNNIIVVNWVEDSVDIYDRAVRHVPGVGIKISEFIDWMTQKGWIDLQQTTLLGHSLGSHVAGVAARYLKTGQVHEVIGLDPASPRFNYTTSTVRLRSTDAYYVESIQTCAGTLGYEEPIGKAAFYPAGGRYQPGCFLDLGKACSHFRAYEYYAEAIKSGKGFPSVKCNSYQDALNSKCGRVYSTTVAMGSQTNDDIASGVFYVPVKPWPPYSY